PSFSGVTALKSIRELFFERSRLILTDFGPFPKWEKAKEDRRFESPLLHQRGTANRRSRSQSVATLSGVKHRHRRARVSISSGTMQNSATAEAIELAVRLWLSGAKVDRR